MKIADFYFDGTTGGDKEFRKFAKRIWFEHVKRRPELDQKINRVARYTPEEIRIFETPLKVLMAEFEKTL